MTATLSREQVEHFVGVATSMGIPAVEVPLLWARHTEYCDQNGGSEYGGRRWIKFCESQVKFIQERVTLSDQDAKRAEARALLRANEERAKRQADAVYAETAVSLTQWLEMLRSQERDGEALIPHEHAVAAAQPPGPRVDAAAWLVATLANAKRHDGAPFPRAQECVEPGCGLPVRRWRAVSGRVYHGYKCADHSPQVRR